ncbi:MAG: phosphoenolpyruvate--protein phosphotransferase [Clostridia bacterium]|nr:phosphoenolpyruvate--protein phosphotransferase [Clostridia bacterium]
MKVYPGQGVSGGVCVGRAAVWSERTYAEEDSQGQTELTAQAHWERFLKSRDAARDALRTLYIQARENVGEQSAEIFDVQAMMLEDADFCQAVRDAIFAQRLGAVAAVRRAGEQMAAMLGAMQDEYLRERAADVKDIANRVIRHLTGGGQEDEWTLPPYPCILCAKELTPAQTARLDRKRVLGFITAHGSATSHTAIVARSMNLPALVGVGEEAIHALREGDTVALDAERGRMCIDPDETVLCEMEEQQASARRHRAAQERFRGRETRTASGRQLYLYANAALPEDVEAARQGDAEGIGLFRSEFLYLGREEAPSEEEQYRIYKDILERMEGRRVIIRTLDIGADKQAGCLPQTGKEENPALGCRAVRHSLLHPSLFLTQAKALLRASVHGRLAVMFPLICSEQELRGILALWDRARGEIGGGGEVERGIMIETPAAALISDRLAGMVDFFSIGTNDLTQYTLAMDRQNEMLQPFLQPHHPAILALIRKTVDSAKAAGIWVGICGELGADFELTETFVQMGVDELSVAPSQILALRKRIAEIK